MCWQLGILDLKLINPKLNWVTYGNSFENQVISIGKFNLSQIRELLPNNTKYFSLNLGTQNDFAKKIVLTQAFF